MVIVLALGSAVGYGVADFIGGACSRRVGALRVLMIGYPVGLVLLVAAAASVGGAPTAAELAWGLASGVAGGTGLIAFYRALARGPMGVVAPVSALAAAVLPVFVGAARGERLHAVVLLGVALCVVAIGLVSMEESKAGESADDEPQPWGLRRVLDSGPLLAAASGLGFGTFFILLAEAGDGSGIWPTAASRVGGLTVVIGAIAVMYVRRRLSGSGQRQADDRKPIGPAIIGLAIVSGGLDAMANVMYFLASQRGVMSLAAVLTSLYPAITVLLARVVFSERLRAVQQIGLAVAAAGVALVTIG